MTSLKAARSHVWVRVRGGPGKFKIVLKKNNRLTRRHAVDECAVRIILYNIHYILLCLLLLYTSCTRETAGGAVQTRAYNRRNKRKNRGREGRVQGREKRNRDTWPTRTRQTVVRSGGRSIFRNFSTLFLLNAKNHQCPRDIGLPTRCVHACVCTMPYDMTAIIIIAMSTRYGRVWDCRASASIIIIIIVVLLMGFKRFSIVFFSLSVRFHTTRIYIYIYTYRRIFFLNMKSPLRLQWRYT